MGKVTSHTWPVVVSGHSVPSASRYEHLPTPMITSQHTHVYTPDPLTKTPRPRQGHQFNNTARNSTPVNRMSTIIHDCQSHYLGQRIYCYVYPTPSPHHFTH